MTQGNSTDIVIERTFDAPRDLVWKMFTEREHIEKWWGPHGMSTRVDELDLRPGGNWAFVMLGPNDSEYPQSGTFSEIVPPEKIVTTTVFDYGDGEPHRQVMTYLFEDKGDKTLMIMRTTVDKRDVSMTEQITAGWNANWDSLVEYLPTLAAR